MDRVLDLLGAVWMRPAVDHAARAEVLLELRVLRVVLVLRLFLGVEVVEIAEELIEAVSGGQELVAIAEVVLAELSRGVALRLQQFGDRRILLLQSLGRARQTDLGEAGAERRLAGEERRLPRRAALLAVVVGEERSFVRDDPMRVW
jgi:hypothetical protein